MEVGGAGLDDFEFRQWFRRPTLMAANAMYLLASAGNYLSAVILALIMVHVVGPGAYLSYEAYYYMAVTSVCLFLVPPAIYAARHRGVSLSMRLRAPKLKPILLALISAPAAAVFLNLASYIWLGIIEALGGTLTGGGLAAPTNVNELIISILVVGVVPGVCEELLFRGAIMGAWERRGTKYAMIVSSLMFASMHGSFEALPIHIIMGIILAYVVVSSDSLCVGMVYHAAYNITLLLISYYIATQPAPEAVGSAAQEALPLISVVLDPSYWLALALPGGVLIISLIYFSSGDRVRALERVPVIDRTKMGWQELLVLMVAVISVSVLYVVSILEIFTSVSLS